MPSPSLWSSDVSDLVTLHCISVIEMRHTSSNGDCHIWGYSFVALKFEVNRQSVTCRNNWLFLYTYLYVFSMVLCSPIPPTTMFSSLREPDLSHLGWPVSHRQSSSSSSSTQSVVCHILERFRDYNLCYSSFRLGPAAKKLLQKSYSRNLSRGHKCVREVT